MLDGWEALQREAANAGVAIAFAEAEDGTPYATLERCGIPLYGLERHLGGWVIYSLADGRLVRAQPVTQQLFEGLAIRAGFDDRAALPPVLPSTSLAA